MNPVSYECTECTYWEATHGVDGFDFNDEKYKKCQNCNKRIRIYRSWVEDKGGLEHHWGLDE